jgi:hypothetical protein
VLGVVLAEESALSLCPGVEVAIVVVHFSFQSLSKNFNCRKALIPDWEFEKRGICFQSLMPFTLYVFCPRSGSKLYQDRAIRNTILDEMPFKLGSHDRSPTRRYQPFNP